ncbi:MAG: acyltransferase [Clostridia bacterium]|nr:acyltransferase [Clostridia bacterium]
MRKRNNLVEFARFLFSILVVGYHVQMTFSDGTANFFANGALAVEFFFLISGYFLARSIEKINAKEKHNTALESCRFMGNKVKGILPIHITAIVAVVIVILACDLSSSGKILLNGLPSVFLVQEAGIWTEAYANALIVPEWYLSSMLLCMLIMVPVALLLRKKIKGVFVILVLLGVLGVIAVIAGLCMNWAYTTTFVYDLRAWGEMCVGMFAYYLSVLISKRELKKASSITLKVVEILGYCAPVILGFIPISENLQPVCMGVTVVCVFAALSVTFAGKGVSVSNDRLNKAFGYLGGLSLAIYLFHPVIITLLEYVGKSFSIWQIYLIVFAVTLAAAVIYNLIAMLIKRLIKAIKARKQPETAEINN